VKLKNVNAALRQALELDGVEIGKHREELDKLTELYGHSIRFVRSKEGDQTCAAYALGLSGNRTYRSVAAWAEMGIFERSVSTNSAFMTWLLEGRLQEIDEPIAGCLVCYLSGDEWKHVGIMGANGKVTSKWGTFPLYEHALDEVQESYGDEVRFFVRPSEEEALALYLQFASEKGVSREDVEDACEDCSDLWMDETLT
jgi:hypothetical protein